MKKQVCYNCLRITKEQNFKDKEGFVFTCDMVECSACKKYYPRSAMYEIDSDKDMK